MTKPKSLAAALCVFFSAKHGAAADSGPRPELRAELGVGTMITSVQREDLGYGAALEGSFRPGLRVGEMIVPELTLGSWLFPSSRGTGLASLLGAGLHIDPRLNDNTALFFDVHGGVGITGSQSRFMFDLGAGVELTVRRGFALCPFLRYGQMLTTSSDVGTDPKFWALGISFALSFPAPPPPPPPPAPPAPAPPPPKPSDRDGDGVTDPEDQCPDQAKGEHSDPDKPGCPAPDSDGDGVVDPEDKCPQQPAGHTPDPERTGCPDGDDDSDGVANHQDKCPQVPIGLYPDPLEFGCPLPDRDKDMVPDLYDACPDKPGAPSTDPKKSGCPGLVQIDNGVIKILKPLFFATNKDTILSRSFPVLKAMADALKATPGIQKVSIDGHTDNQGLPDKNLDLSQRRSESVRKSLVGYGIEAGRLDAKGFGDSKPVMPNQTAKGRAANRRVEFVIVDPPPAADRKP